MAEAIGKIVVKVDPEVMREKAERVGQLAEQSIQMLDDMETKVNAGREYWNGDAAKLYRSVFAAEKKQCVQCLENLQNFQKELLYMAGIYKKTEQKAAAAVDSINEMKMD